LEVAQAGADGVIIGSRIVKFIEENPENPARIKENITRFIRDVLDMLPPQSPKSRSSS